MVDNVPITAGVGTSVATDDVGGVHYQKVKLVTGADDVAADILTTKVGVSFNRPADTTAYTANDAVADNTSAGLVTKLEWAIPAGRGIIRRVRVSKTTPGSPMTLRLWLWDTTFTVGAGDNAAFAAPLIDSIGYVDVIVNQVGSDRALGWTNIDFPFVAGTLFGLYQILVGATPASGTTFTTDLFYLPG